MCSSSDALTSTSANPGPDIEGCTFNGLFHDDCIAIHDNYVISSNATVDANTVTVDAISTFQSGGTVNGTGDLQAGQPVRISNYNGYFTNATCVAIAGLTLTLNKNLSVPAGSLISNPDADGEGYQIIDCAIRDARSRGIMAKATMV